MGGVVSAIFGGGKSSAPDNSAQIAQMEANNKAQEKRLEAQQTKLDDDERKKGELAAAAARARRRGGSRMLLSDSRLNPETGIESQTTLGPQS